MTARIYVPNDTTAWSVGADEVATAILDRIVELGLDAEVIRNGSRGLYWLEPLVEVDSPAGRIGFGPVTPEDVAALFAGSVLPTADHALSVGLVEAIPFLRDQTRVTFARAGIIEPLSLADYHAHGGGIGLANALSLTSQ